MGLGYEFETTVLCVDSYENSIPCGRYYNPRDGEEKQFFGLMKLLSQIEDSIGGAGPPESFAGAEMKSGFAKTHAMPIDTEIKDGKKATFLIKILFRQNASWQGSVAWLEGKQEQSFRSVLELLFLMDGVLSNNTENTN